jgi:type IV pilus assembly protein PilM
MWVSEKRNSMENAEKTSLWQKISEKLTPKNNTKEVKYTTLPKASNLISLDINSDSCCLLKASGTPPKLTLLQADINPLPHESLQEGKLATPLALETTLRQMMKRNQLKKNQCAFYLPGSLVMNKQISISKSMTDTQIQTKAEVEAKKAFPDESDEFYIDYIRNDSANKSQLLNIVAIHKADIEPFLNTLKKVNLRSSIVDVDYYALDRIYPLLQSHLEETIRHKVNALFHLTSSYFLMITSKGEEFIYTHRHPYKNPNVIKVIAAILNDTDRVPLSPEDFDSIGKAIAHLLQFYFAEFQNSTVGTIMLSGPLAMIPNIANHVAQYTTIATIVVDPLKDVENKTAISNERLHELSPAMALSLSLAMRGT